MKIELADYLTAAEAAEALGTNKRGLYRAKARAERDGHVVQATILGKSVFLAKAIKTLRNYYYPYFSEAHQRMVKEWGRQGGTTKARNLRSRSSASGTQRESTEG